MALEVTLSYNDLSIDGNVAADSGDVTVSDDGGSMGDSGDMTGDDGGVTVDRMAVLPTCMWHWTPQPYTFHIFEHMKATFRRQEYLEAVRII